MNRWQLHHRLHFGPMKLALFLNQPPLYNLPPPYLPDSETQLKVYDAAVNTPRAASGAHKSGAYDAKYRREIAPKVAPPTMPTLPAGAAAKAPEKKCLRSIPGCLCLLAVSSYGEVRVFVQVAAGAGGGEWSSASARLSSHHLPDSSSRSTSRTIAASETTCNHAVVCVEQATVTERKGQLLLAVAHHSHIMFFTLKCSYWPLQVTATPHTRIQLKTDIKLHGMPLQSPSMSRLVSPLLVHMAAHAKSEDLVIIYRTPAPALAGHTVGGGQLRVERMRLRDKGVAVVVADPNAPDAPALEAPVEALQWVIQANAVIQGNALIHADPDLHPHASSDGKEEEEVKHVGLTVDGQFVVLAMSSGKVQLRFLDNLALAPPEAYVVYLGHHAAEGRTWGTVVCSCSSPTGNCMFLVDSVGRGKLVEMPHPWAMLPASVSSIVNHVVHLLEMSLCNMNDMFDIFLTLAGIVRRHAQGLTLLEGVIKVVRHNYKMVPEGQQGFYRHMHHILMLRLLSLSADEGHKMEAKCCEGRLLLFYLLDTFRFARPLASPPCSMQRPQPGVGGAGVPAPLAPLPLPGSWEARMKTRCVDMMLTMGESIVGLTVWNLRQATLAIQYDNDCAMQYHDKSAHQPPQLGGEQGANAWGAQFRNFVHDAHAVSLTKDLLMFYHKKLQEQHQHDHLPPLPPPSPVIAPPAASLDQEAGATEWAMGAVKIGVTRESLAGVATPQSSAPVMPPPALHDAPLDQPACQLAHLPPVPVLHGAEGREHEGDSHEAQGQDDRTDTDIKDKVDDRSLSCGRDYTIHDLKKLIEILDQVVQAHKLLETHKPHASADHLPGAATDAHQKLLHDQHQAQIKHKLFNVALSEKEVDPERGLEQQLAQGAFARPPFSHASLDKLLSLSRSPQGFQARACGCVLLCCCAGACVLYAPALLLLCAIVLCVLVLLQCRCCAMHCNSNGCAMHLICQLHLRLGACGLVGLVKVLAAPYLVKVFAALYLVKVLAAPYPPFGGYSLCSFVPHTGAFCSLVLALSGARHGTYEAAKASAGARDIARGDRSLQVIGA